MTEPLLDTDIVSEILKGKNANVAAHAGRHFAEFGRCRFSAITWYEIVRGLKSKQATAQLADFRTVAARSLVEPITFDLLEAASDLWAEARRQGHPAEDADLLIAATALRSGGALVTGNLTHFSWIPGLTLLDWRAEP